MVLSRELSATSSRPSQVHAADIMLEKNELNALRYASGYVPHALLKKYEKRCGSKYNSFIECLGGSTESRCRY